MIAGMLDPFKEAVKAVEGDNLGLAQVLCTIIVLNAHVEAEVAVKQQTRAPQQTIIPSRFQVFEASFSLLQASCHRTS